MTIRLTDDGTLDTVLRCSECGEEFRFNFAASEWADAGTGDTGTPLPSGRDLYDQFVEECIEDVEAEHACEDREHKHADAMDRWARRYDDLNGAPENDEDR